MSYENTVNKEEYLNASDEQKRKLIKKHVVNPIERNLDTDWLSKSFKKDMLELSVYHFIENVLRE